MRNDAIDVKVNKGLLAFGAEEEGAVGGVVHEEIFGEDGGAAGVAEEGEAGFQVGGGVGVEGGDKGIGPGVSTDGVGAPAAGGEPAVAPAGGIPLQVVMKWTGHSDYQAMKPYIDIAEKTKANAIKLF